MLASALLLALLASPGAARGAPAPSATLAACNPSLHLDSWSDVRLAAQTVVVPAQAGQVGATAPLLHTGYGGVLLFGSSAPSTLGTTIARLQAETPQHLGALVMTDEEGGGVLRLENLVAPFPWPRTMAATMTPGQITALAHRVGAQLLAAGVDMDLAPVLDVDGRDVEPSAKDPDGYRSFGGSVATVAHDGDAFAAGLRAAGVVPVVKHFPGLGGSTGNTDDGPAATLPWRTLEAGPLQTFEHAIAAGAPAVMVANARIPGLTPLPASVSENVLTGVLRDSLHFRGLIVTDSLTAGAISAVPLSVPNAAVLALQGGADLVLLGAQKSPAANDALAVQVANAIAAAVARGTLARTTLLAAATQVLAAHGEQACTTA